MLKKYSRVLVTILFVSDIVIAGICWNAAYFFRFFWMEFPLVKSIPPLKPYFNASGAVVLLAMVCFVNGKMYYPKRFFRFKAEFKTIVRSNVVLFILLIAASFFYRKFSYSRAHTIYFLFLSIVSITFFRLVIRNILWYLRKKNKNVRRILIIGDGRNALRFFNKVKKNNWLGFIMLGVVCPEENQSLVPLPHLGKYKELPDIIASNSIDQIYLALDSDKQSDLKEINHYLAEQTVDLNIVPDISHTLNINPEVLDFDGLPVITLRQSPLEGWNRIFKRLFDIFGATIAIIAFLPFWIIIPIITKLTSPGPVFYTQERMGVDLKRFKMYKFRTMDIDAESETGAVWAKKDDHRRTVFGAFLRRISFDEIPQFFNVIQGSMSLVGPRPERPIFIEKFKSQIPNYMLRHKTKAGITGWAQVNGWRGNTSLEKRIDYDIYYLTHWSIWFDIRILVLTLFAGFTDKNAY